MTKKSKFIIGVVLIVMLVGASTAYALTLEDPSTTWNVHPTNIPYTQENRYCDNGTLITDQFQSLIDGDTSGSKTIDYTIDGRTVSMTIDWYVDNTFDFTVTGGVVHKFMVKGGLNTYLIYQYDPPVPFALNNGPVSYDTGLHDGVNNNGDAQDFSHLEFCLTPVYPLRGEKTAAGSYDRTVTWTLDKSVDDNSHSGFAGQVAGTSNWTVVADKTETLGNYQVTGSITVYNDNGFAVPISIDDILDDGTFATVSCPSYTVPAASSGIAGEITCTYAASPADASATLNTATILSTSTEFAVEGDVATAEVSFTENLIGYDYGTLSDDNLYNPNGTTVISGDTTWAYSQTFTCSDNPADYTNGTYSFNVPNTAKLNGNLNLSDTENVTVTCYAPVISKTASASYDERHDWSITKTVKPESQSAFAGDPVNWTWNVDIDETVVDQNFSVIGDIKVSNPTGAPGDMTVDLADVLNDGTTAVVDCGAGATSVTVAPGASATCSYAAIPADASATLNTATGTFKGIDFVATAVVSFKTNVVNDSAIFSDPYLGIGDTVVTDPSSTDYPEGDVCSSNPEDYGTDGKYTISLKNIAYLDDEVGNSYSDDATTTYTCYAPIISKTASASYDERHDWEVVKTVEPKSQSAFAGDPVSWVWNIVIKETVVDQNFSVTGDIKVSNPAGSPGDMKIDLADVLNDGTSALVDCGAGATSVTVAPGASATCSYAASPADASATLNTATGTFNLIDFPATAIVSFNKNVLNDSATFSDSYLGIGDTVVYDSSDTDYDDGAVCSSNPEAYGTDGMYKKDVTNTAILIDEESTTYKSTATTTYTCYAPVITKTAAGTYDEHWTWKLEKSVDPTSQTEFAGNALDDWTWTVKVSEGFVEENFAVTGDIYVANPTGSPGDMTVDLADQLGDGTVAAVTCPDGGTSITVSPGATGTCSYTAKPDNRTVTLNTATGTFNGITGFTGTAGITFTKNIVNGTALVTDGKIGLNESLTAGDGGKREWTGTEGDVCSSDPAAYKDGKYSDFEDNTAYLTSVEQSLMDSAKTAWTCYAPVLSKTAAGSYDERHDWDVVKTVAPETQSAFAGDPVKWVWTVEIKETVKDQNFAVTGDIKVSNPTGSPGDMVVDLADQLNEGTIAAVTCPGGGSSITVATGTTGTCSYIAKPADDSATFNIATGTFNLIDFTAKADVSFTKNVVNDSATFSDPDLGIEETVVTDPSTTKYPGDDVCSSNPEIYGEDGKYSQLVFNTAYLVDEELTEYQDTAFTIYNCYLWDVNKTADGSYNDRYAWEIDKTVKPASQSGFAGDTLSWEWTITWNAYFVSEENHKVTGVITVDNPAPMPLTVNVTDYLSGGFAANVVCNDADQGTDLTIAANSSGTCDYTAAPGSQLAENKATATRNSISVSDTVDVNWVKGPDSGMDATITDSNHEVIPLDSEQPFTYTESVDCSRDTTIYKDNGVSYSGSADNTATITWDIDSTSDSASTSYTCYIPTISKDAAGTYDERHDWEVEKTVNPTSQSAFAGDTVYFDWTITVDEWVTEENFDVSGTITVKNPNPEDDLIVPLSDVFSDGTPGVIDPSTCKFDGTYLTVLAGETEVCGYAARASGLAESNKATITLNGIDFDATDPIEWTVNKIKENADLYDDWKYEGLSVYDGWTGTYQGSYTCSSDVGIYVDNQDLGNEVYNLAILKDGDTEIHRDDATTYIDCYIPSISKTAAGTYDERHDWNVLKSVTPTYQEGYPGDTLSWLWTIDVFEDISEENFDVAGTITVGNPNPEDTLVVPLTDMLSDGSAVVIDQSSCNFDGTDLTVAPAGQETCDYTANDLGYTALVDAAEKNYASILMNGILFKTNADIEWKVNLIRPTATLSDEKIGLTGLTVKGGDQFTGPGSITCATDRASYGDTGSYGKIETNRATLTDSEGTDYISDAQTEWVCKATFVDIYKTLNGDPAPSDQHIQFTLFSGNTQLDTVDTYNNGANLQFQTALVPGDSYTICEYPVPAGYTFEVYENGNYISTYPGPPGADNPTGEIQCFDFTAGAATTTLTFDIENSYPGGAPRTPGYWKNWSSCSGGNQYETAAELGGPAAGVYVLDDFLGLEPPVTIVGDFEIETCEQGVLVLSAYTVANKPKNMNNDAAYKLAQSLLAAKLNLGAGACVPLTSDTWTYDGQTMTFTQVMAEADGLLSGIGFDGTDAYFDSKTLKKTPSLKETAAYAQWLAGILDDYNNSEICTGEPSH